MASKDKPKKPVKKIATKKVAGTKKKGGSGY